jgi:hypothetical protein
MTDKLKFQRNAQHLRKVSGSTELEHTLRKVATVLAQHGVPHLVGGGFAVQEHGYARFTEDLDVIIPNFATAQKILLANGFDKSAKSSVDVVDRDSGVDIHLLRGGEKMGLAHLPLPMPVQASAEPQILPIDMLISLKLSAGRAQDFADVVELIKANSLPKEYLVDTAAKLDYEEAWQVAAAETAAEGLVGE